MKRNNHKSHKSILKDKDKIMPIEEIKIMEEESAKVICACEVKYLGKNGTDEDKRKADMQLKIGKVYTIYRIDIGDWETRISLKGLPNDFNSAMFEPVDWIN